VHEGVSAYCHGHLLRNQFAVFFALSLEVVDLLIVDLLFLTLTAFDADIVLSRFSSCMFLGYSGPSMRTVSLTCKTFLNELEGRCVGGFRN
jgi:hypothetical protein